MPASLFQLSGLALTLALLLGVASQRAQAQFAPALEYDASVNDQALCDDEWVEMQGFGQSPMWADLRERLRPKHSSTDGRATGKGIPLRTTSWLNRPYEFGLDTGAFIMGKRASGNNARNNDLMAAAHLGADWDHYWGAQARIAWSTPEFVSSVDSTSQTSDSILIYDVSLLYYPWGDSRIRPYYRLGLGLTDLDFINNDGIREDNTMLTMPLGIGIKYQSERWLAIRAEAVDHFTWGQNSASSMQNFTLTLGFEWRYGGRPNSGWSSPRRETW